MMKLNQDEIRERDDEMTESMNWNFIDDLPNDWQRLASSELESIHKIWLEQFRRLSESNAGRHFNERLRRKWAIETGVIENLYTIDRGITQLLIEKGIETSLIPYGATNRPTELVVAIVKDQEAALEDLFEFVNYKRQLTTSYIKQLHQLFTRHQDTVEAKFPNGQIADVVLLKGEWKKMPNSPTRRDGIIHQYTPPEHVASEMDTLVSLHEKHESAGVAPEVEAAWIHHRFTQIHPFQDGNGRIARALASLIFIKSRLFPIVITRDTREEYIVALENADQGNLTSLVTLFVRSQKESFLEAISISEELLHKEDPVKELISSAAGILKARQEIHQRKLQSVFETANQLCQTTDDVLTQAARDLDYELKRVNPSYAVYTDQSSETTEHWFRQQAVDLAKRFGYYAEFRTYRSWNRMKIVVEERATHLIVSFHSVGVEFHGILVASASLEFRDKSEDGDTNVDGPYPICRDVFQFGYTEDPDAVKLRFDGWIGDVLVIGLDEWRKQL